jgi:NADPH-dependent F420 reductase
VPPTVAIIGGTGAEGLGLALRFSRAGCRVLIGSRDLARAQAGAARVPGATGLLNVAAAAQAEFVVLTVPATKRVHALDSVRDHLRPGAILIDTSVHIPPDPAAEPLRPPPGVALVVAFQTVSAQLLQDAGRPLDSDVLLCGDDAAAKAGVAALIHLLPGARPVDAGPLKSAPLLESLASLLIAINRRYKVKHSGVRITGLPDPLPS